jgi:hypothetical protein
MACPQVKAKQFDTAASSFLVSHVVRSDQVQMACPQVKVKQFDTAASSFLYLQLFIQVYMLSLMAKSK